MAIRKPARSDPPEAPRPLFPEPLSHPLTVDDWFNLPGDGSVLYELFEGVLLLMNTPARRHQDIIFQLARKMAEVADANGGYAGIAPLGVILSERIGFIPDAIYVSAERREILSERGVEAAPDVVVEVLSPSTGAFDRGTKLRTYLERGVREVWLVDPVECVTEVATQEGRTRAGFGEPIQSAILQAGDGGLGQFKEPARES